MRVISRKTLRDFWEVQHHADAEAPLSAWFVEAEKAGWATLAAVKAQYASASVLKDGRVVFNIGGNKYCLVVRIRFDKRIAFIRFVGTRREYDEIDVQTI